jgi:prepilin-type N-terminal cleavage/methylation domain-containing protein
MALTPHRHAFTLMELLVVIAIMAILASLIMVGVQAISGNAGARKTDSIIQAVRQGIELAVVNKGSAISPTDHPLAGSREPRFLFTRGVDGSSVATSGYALRGVPDVRNLSMMRSQLQLPTDRYAETRVPVLYGAMRQDIGVLQSLRKVVTQHLSLPKPPPPRPDAVSERDRYPYVISPVTGSATDKYDDESSYPNALVPGAAAEADRNYGLLGDAKLALDYLFGNSNAQAELAGLKALYNADPKLPEDVNTYRTAIENRSVSGATEGLVYTNYGTPGQSDSKTMKKKYEPGYIPVGSASGSRTSLASPAGANWVKYRLAGLAIYDAWQTELFTVLDSAGGYRVFSAGMNGVLAIDPGKDLIFNTINITADPNNTRTQGQIVFAGDDRDGSKDNRQ